MPFRRDLGERIRALASPMVLQLRNCEHGLHTFVARDAWVSLQYELALNKLLYGSNRIPEWASADDRQELQRMADVLGPGGARKSSCKTYDLGCLALSGETLLDEMKGCPLQVLKHGLLVGAFV